MKLLFNVSCDRNILNLKPAVSHLFNRRKREWRWPLSTKNGELGPLASLCPEVFEKNVGQSDSLIQKCRYKNVGSFNLIVFFLLQSIISCAQDNENFVRGNNFFAAGRYVQASDAYKKIEDKGFAVFYNLGLSYLYQGKQAQAIICCKRAEKQANFQQLTQLYELSDCMHRQIDPDYVPGWYDQLAIFVKKCILSISILLLQLLVLLAMILFMLCWYKQWYPMNMKAWACIIVLYGAVVFAWWYKTDMMQQRIGIITKELVYIFAGPDTSFYKKAELHDADEVVIIAVQKGYYQVRAKQTIGWIHDNDVELV